MIPSTYMLSKLSSRTLSAKMFEVAYTNHLNKSTQHLQNWDFGIVESNY